MLQSRLCARVFSSAEQVCIWTRHTPHSIDQTAQNILLKCFKTSKILDPYLFYLIVTVVYFRVVVQMSRGSVFPDCVLSGY